MSLILDALRKSEAERRRGAAPDLFAPMPATRARAPARALSLPLLAPLALLLVGGLWWWSAPTPSPRIEPRIDRDAPAAPMTPSTTQTTTVAVAAAPAPDRARSASVGKPAPATQPTPMTPPPTASMAPSRPLPRALPPASTRPAPMLAPAQLPTPAPIEPSLPGLGDLDPALRAALPPLKLSMHVWAEDPAQRFVIIDGRRVIEGSDLGGTVLREIRRDGVVLSIDGRDYFLPR